MHEGRSRKNSLSISNKEEITVCGSTPQYVQPHPNSLTYPTLFPQVALSPSLGT